MVQGNGSASCFVAMHAAAVFWALACAPKLMVGSLPGIDQAKSEQRALKYACSWCSGEGRPAHAGYTQHARLKQD